MRTTLTILRLFRNAMCVGACLLWAVPAYAVEPTLARLSIWLPPERMVEFATSHQAKLLPILNSHELVQSAEPARAPVDSVFSRLFEFGTPVNVIEAQEALAASEPWKVGGRDDYSL